MVTFSQVFNSPPRLFAKDGEEGGCLDCGNIAQYFFYCKKCSGDFQFIFREWESIITGKKRHALDKRILAIPKRWTYCLRFLTNLRMMQKCRFFVGGIKNYLNGDEDVSFFMARALAYVLIISAL